MRSGLFLRIAAWQKSALAAVIVATCAEEARKQIERDASIVKARTKLEERGGAAKLDF